MMKRILLLLSLFVLAVPLRAQTGEAMLSVPFDFGLLLSGNFGELRSNHFHSGVDFKTQGVVGKPIKCVADGYISRATVQPGGYGQAIYVIHDNGYMTVYGHLERFPEAVERRVREAQYENESFSVDISFAPDEFLVKRGELLAVAGNSGYSFGPHLHFEVRDTTGNELYDPMPFYAGKLKDRRPPVASEIAVYPAPGAGVVDTLGISRVYKINDGTVNDTIEVWGRVGFGVKALDYMDGVNNKYGVYRMELWVDDSLRFSSRMDNFSFAENRLINAWADYPRYVNGGEWFLRMFILENNPLRALSADANNGWLDVCEERLYKVEFRLSDYHGNSSSYLMNVHGKRCGIPAPMASYHLSWFLNNAIEHEGMRLDVPRGEFFEDALFDVDVADGEYGVSRRYSIGNEPLPLWHGAELSLKVDSLSVDSSKLYIKRVTEKGGYSVGGKYKDGWVSTDISSLGCFEVAVDTVAPKLSPVKENVWMRNGRVVLAVGERETSVKSFRGTLDGEFVLFGYSSKNRRMVFDLRKENVARGKHTLRLEVTDACGNMAVYEKNIDFR